MARVPLEELVLSVKRLRLGAAATVLQEALEPPQSAGMVSDAWVEFGG